MGHDHEGGAEADLQVHELELGLLAQLLVERGERLVEQQDARAFRQRARQGDALALPAGELLGIAVSQRLELHEAQHLVDAGRDLRLRQAILLEAEGDVAGDRQVRKQRIGLEHHVHGPPVGRHRREILAPQQDAPARRRLEAGEEPQQGALAATRRTEQAEKLALENGEAEIVDGGDAAETLGDMIEADQGDGGRIAPGREGPADGADGGAGGRMQVAQFPIGLLPLAASAGVTTQRFIAHPSPRWERASSANWPTRQARGRSRALSDSAFPLTLPSLPNGETVSR